MNRANIAVTISVLQLLTNTKNEVEKKERRRLEEKREINVFGLWSDE